VAHEDVQALARLDVPHPERGVTRSGHDPGVPSFDLKRRLHDE
jgi:hypothetical protein